jgi:hypothetical protein
MRTVWEVLILTLAIALPCCAWAGAAGWPSGAGLAAKYPGDKGIARDPAVVFAEGFEVDSVEALKARWDQVNTEITSLSEERPAASGGRKSLLFTHVGGKGDGGHLYRILKPGFDQLYLRFYVKFDPECNPIHHFVHLGGYNPPTPYPQGGAGLRPAGDRAFSTGVEPHGEAWVWDYYSYWMEMRGSPPRGQTWGNTFIRDPKLKVVRGKWICVELWMKMNDVGDSNGEMALWIDGKPVSHLGKGFPKGTWTYDKFTPGAGGDGIRWDDATGKPAYFTNPPDGLPFEGFRWRSTTDLKLSYLWLLDYITEAPEGHVSKVWFDDIVVATKYIGPTKR